VTASDDLDAKRARIDRLVRLGKRIGYSAYGLAMVLFVIGFVGRFTAGLSQAIVACMVVGSLVLPPAIVFGYGLKAALREERGGH